MTFQPPYRPSGRSVWLGKDLVATDDWIVRLSPATIEEIDASVSRLRGRNAYEAPVTRDEFPLSTMVDDVTRMRQEIATGRGFFVFRGLDRDRYSDNELGLIFRGFGAHFGHELTQSAFGDRLGDIRDISDVLVDRNQRRGYQSGGFQTAHTDPSGELGIVAMLSLKMAASGGESLIASAHTVHNMLLDWCPDLLEEFYKGFILRRPDSDAKRMSQPAVIGNVPSFVYENGWLNCDFQHGYLRRAVECGDTTINPKQEAALGAFVGISNHPDVMLKMMLKPGDFQFINNRTILHGRAHFVDHEAKARRRHLYRLWLNVPEWPRMPVSQSTLVAGDMARWDAMAAQHRAETPAWASWPAPGRNPLLLWRRPQAREISDVLSNSWLESLRIGVAA